MRGNFRVVEGAQNSAKAPVAEAMGSTVEKDCRAAARRYPVAGSAKNSARRTSRLDTERRQQIPQRSLTSCSSFLIDEPRPIGPQVVESITRSLKARPVS